MQVLVWTPFAVGAVMLLALSVAVFELSAVFLRLVSLVQVVFL